jgi:predicted nucleotidyltransferase
MLNSDYKDILLALSEQKVKFLLVGAYAMAVHGYPRSTMDIDLWIFSEAENSLRVFKALENFGAPMDDLSPEDLQKENVVFQIGVAPRRIDIITSADGLIFEEAFANAKSIEIEGICLRVLSVPDLIKNKRATGKTKDLADVEALEVLGGKSSFH